MTDAEEEPVPVDSRDRAAERVVDWEAVARAILSEHHMIQWNSDPGPVPGLSPSEALAHFISEHSHPAPPAPAVERVGDEPWPQAWRNGRNVCAGAAHNSVMLAQATSEHTARQIVDRLNEPAALRAELEARRGQQGSIVLCDNCAAISAELQAAKEGWAVATTVIRDLRDSATMTTVVTLRASNAALVALLRELVEVADLRGDNDLPHPSADDTLWTARMQTAWDDAAVYLATHAGNEPGGG